MLGMDNFTIDHMMENGDKRVSGWLLMSSPWPTVYIILIYFALIYGFLPAYMKNRKPYKLKTIIRIYNIYQIVMCIYILQWTIQAGWIQGLYSFSCEPMSFSSNPESLSLLKCFHWVYFLKMSELIETIFFNLRKKANQISTLHVYHHSSTFAMSWIACKYVGGAAASVPLMLNSFIHILMYTYYFLSSLGPKWQKKLAPWKPKLTIAQMIQFTIILIHALLNLQPGCRSPRLFIAAFIPNVILVYKMFYDFYKANYIKQR
ncbi:very long chain fatty acid elongase AAEL008004-like [Euwallacea fornicatus]|uniref:very long chain fatty acid elongase AAEL008004-like n=1 Tax=Euwallacea fornicatus TaxID=995702 RepID=UPI00338F94D7